MPDTAGLAIQQYAGMASAHASDYRQSENLICRNTFYISYRCHTDRDHCAPVWLLQCHCENSHCRATNSRRCQASPEPPEESPSPSRAYSDLQQFAADEWTDVPVEQLTLLTTCQGTSRKGVCSYTRLWLT